MSKIKIGLRLRLAHRAFKEEVFSVSGNGRRNTFSQDFHGRIERDIEVLNILPREEFFKETKHLWVLSLVFV